MSEKKKSFLTYIVERLKVGELNTEVQVQAYKALKEQSEAGSELYTKDGDVIYVSEDGIPVDDQGESLLPDLSGGSEPAEE